LGFISDFHGVWDNKLGHNSPLHAGPADQSATEKQLNIDASVNYWIQQGAPKQKLILGMPLYGRTFMMANAQNQKPGAPITGPGPAGPYTRQQGMLGYNEVCVNKNQWRRVWDDQQKAPYAINGNQWLSYDDVESIGLKVDYANNKGLGGGMVWSIETDDFQGDCGQGRYPLLQKIKGGLRIGTKVVEENVEEDDMGVSVESSNWNFFKKFILKIDVTY
jgi:chitinase